MSHKEKTANADQHLQVLDVSIVDVLSHLEALLRHSHSIQRALLQLRSEAPPPAPQVPDRVIGALRENGEKMEQEWVMLGEIIRDLLTGIDLLSGAQNVRERRSGRDRRMVLE